MVNGGHPYILNKIECKVNPIVQIFFRQLEKGVEKRDDHAVERNACQYRWCNNSKERHEPFTTMAGAVSAQPCYEDKDVDRDLD